MSAGSDPADLTPREASMVREALRKKAVQQLGPIVDGSIIVRNFVIFAEVERIAKEIISGDTELLPNGSTLGQIVYINFLGVRTVYYWAWVCGEQRHTRYATADEARRHAETA